MASTYYATGDTLAVTDTYRDGHQMLEQNNNGSPSKTQLQAKWSYIDDKGNVQGVASTSSTRRETRRDRFGSC
jgi:hypothetical protein